MGTSTMFIFKRKQTVVDIGGVQFGGQPGENPTVLAGGVFFRGQPIIKNPDKGIFNEEMLGRWIQRMEDMMTLTGHPGLIQIYGATPEALVKHITWVTDHWKGPFTFESIDPLTRMRAMEYVANAGLQHRAIFNSVNISTSSEELSKIKYCKLQAAIALGWSPQTKSLEDRMKVIRDQIGRCERMGIKKIIVDPASLPVDIGYGLEWRTNIAIKSEMGNPIGNGAFNAPSTWRLYRANKGDEITRTAILIASVAAAQLACADMIFYGSLARTKEIFAAVAFIENGVVRTVSEALTTLAIKRNLFTPRI